MSHPYPSHPVGPRGDGLADVLERVLDKGLVIAGDVQLSLLDIEVLTLKVRLLVASADTAQQMGIDWWRHDPFLSSSADVERVEVEEGADGSERALVERADRDSTAEVAALERRISELEAQLAKRERPRDDDPGEGRRATVPQNRTLADDDAPWQEADAQARKDRAAQQGGSAANTETQHAETPEGMQDEQSAASEDEGDDGGPEPPARDDLP